MNVLSSVSACTGCSACYSVCPNKAITMVPNYEGFLYPSIDEFKCTNCGLCCNTCPVITPPPKSEEYLEAYAIKAYDDLIRATSSSGGVFYMLAKACIDKGGAVYGAVINDDFSVVHRRIQALDDLAPLMRSKYVQSDINHTFIQVQADLANHIPVLFSGTHCQIAGLKSFLQVENIDTARLLLCDFVCHGVPSPLVWQDSLKTIEAEQSVQLTSAYFREKRNGWRDSFAIYYTTKSSGSVVYEDRRFMEMFLKDYILRESCHQCPYKTPYRTSDITLADFWGIESSSLSSIDDNKGVSMVLIHSEKGQQSLDRLSDSDMAMVQLLTIDEAIKEQQALRSPYPQPINHSAFWSDYLINGFNYAYQNYIKSPEMATNYQLRDQNNSPILILPDGPGSKGDEALLRGFLNVLNTPKLIVLNPRTEFWCDTIPDRALSFEEHNIPLEKMADALHHPHKLFVLGTDTIDGSCGLESSLPRISAANEVALAGGDVFIFCSFRSDVNETIISAIKALPDNVHFFLRDELSLANFNASVQRECSFFPDFAFFAERLDTLSVQEAVSHLEKLAHRQTPLIGVNYSEPSFLSLYSDHTLVNRLTYVSTLYEAIIEVLPNAHIVLISHDTRHWENYLSDSDYQQLALRYAQQKGYSAALTVLPSRLSHSELLGILPLLDVVISGRMHLGIASIRSNVIPLIFTGDGANGKWSMIDKVRGMMGNRLNNADNVVSNLPSLKKVLQMLYADSKLNKEKLSKKNNELAEADQANAEWLRQKTDVPQLHVNPPEILRLKEQLMMAAERAFLKDEKHTANAITKKADATMLQDEPKEIARLNGDIEKLSRWGQDLDKEIEKLRIIIGERDRINEANVQTIAAKDMNLADLHNMIDLLQNQVNTIAMQLSEKQSAVDGLAAQLDEKRLAYDDLAAQLDEKQADFEELVMSHKALQDNLEKLNRDFGDRQYEISCVKAQQDDLNRQISTIVNSKAWRIGRSLQKLSGSVLPPGSRRRLVVRYTFKSFRHPIRMIKGISFKKMRHFAGRLFHGDLFSLVVMKQAQEACIINQEKKNHLDIVVPNSVNKTIYDYGMLVFPQYESPKVSIIIPVYNQFDFTYACLGSILRNTPDIEYEVIIADDVSTDLTIKLGEVAQNIHIIRNDTNKRFLLNCNNAAKSAKGEYILFLNNDTQVQPNWLSALVTLIDSDETIGMVGPKFVYPDGRLQEAGGIVWDNGNAWNYGRYQDPDAPEYNYVKEVDYITGASILVRHSLWKDIGGFDERYVPAYCEDSDLAFEVRKHGYKVMYQPLSVVVHFEGISNGTDTSSGLKSYQTKNSDVFFKKWKDVLKNEHLPDGTDVFHARDRSLGKKTLLMIDHYIPQFDRDAGSRTIFQYLKLFKSKDYNVIFIGDNFCYDKLYAVPLEQMGIEILYGTYYYHNWAKWLEENGNHIDIVFLNRPHISIKYIDVIRTKTKAKLLYYGMDLHYLRKMREYEISNNPSDLEESHYWKNLEYSIMRKVDVSYFPSPIEIAAISKENPSIYARTFPIFMYDNVKKPSYDPISRKNMMFIGGYTHTPNSDAVKWFHDTIWPTIVKRLPDVKMYIIGSNVTEEIKAMNQGNFVVVGPVNDSELESYYASCRLSVVPLRYGAGIKGKVVEAMYHGLPVLTTSIGAEGLTFENHGLFIADDPVAFSKKLCAVYSDSATLKKAAVKNAKCIKTYFSTECVWDFIKHDLD